MSDLVTMTHHLLRELHVDPDTTDVDSEVTNDVKIAIIEAIRSNRRYRLGFNERWFTFQTQTNKGRYALPSDYVGVVQDSVWCVPSSEFLAKQKLKSLPLQHANQVQQSSVASVAYREIGTPYGFSIDPGSKEIVILPIPGQEGDTIEMLYVCDIGTPVFKYVSTAFVFYEPQQQGSQSNTQIALSDTFTNAWFQEAYWMTFYKAALALYARTYGGAPGAAEKLQTYNALFDAQLNMLRAETQMARSVTEIRKHI